MQNTPQNLNLYGIKNCDTVKKARNWLHENNVVYQFHDFRDDGLSGEKLAHWLDAIPAEQLINKRSTTWRNLSDKEKALTKPDDLTDLLLQHPTLIKRPVVETTSTVFCGFDKMRFEQLLA